jgi:hypothetical protein
LNPSTKKLFLKSVQTLLDNYNKSYDSIDKIELTINDSEPRSVDIWVKDDPTISQTIIEIIDAAAKQLCAVSYYVTMRDKHAVMRAI